MIEASVKMVQGLQFVGTGGSGHSVVMDTSPKYGGLDSGLRPMEMLLLGLGGCTGMDTAYVLKKKRQTVTSIEIKLTGQTAPDEPNRFTSMALQYIVSGHDLSEGAVKKAIALSMEKYCPVKATLEGSVDITWTHRVVQVPA